MSRDRKLDRSCEVGLGSIWPEDVARNSRRTPTLDPNPVLFGMEAQNKTKVAVPDELYICYESR
jgi:hypothetical protein